jgi:hypothetical protein
MKYLKFLLFPVLLLTTISCLDSNIQSEEKRLSIYLEIDGLGDELAYNENLLVINEFKFALDRIKLHTAQAVLGTGDNITALIFAYTDEFTQPRLIIDAGLGFSDVEIFNGYEIFLEPVSSRQNVFDNDFFGEDENYSVIIKGEINEESFEFKSTGFFETFYDLDGVQLTDRNETLRILTTLDVEAIFTDPDGNFLDPRVSENDEQIIENLKLNLAVEASPSTIFQ